MRFANPPFTLLAAAGLALALTAPAAAQQPADAPAADIQVIAGVPVSGADDACTFVRNVNGFEATDDDDYVLLTVIGRDRYLAKLAGAGIADPDFAIRAAIISRDSQVCGNGFDSLYIDGERARITKMWKAVPEDRAAAILSRQADAGESGRDGWALSRD